MDKNVRNIDTGFTATLRRIKTACDVIEAGVPFERENHYRIGLGFWRSGLSLEEAVSKALEMTGDEVRSHEVLVLGNDATQIIAIFYDGRAFTPNELIEVLK